MSNPKINYVLEVYADSEQQTHRSMLTKWVADSPFGAIAAGDTLDPSHWHNPLHDCIFRVVSVEHQLYQVDSDTGVETIHKIWLTCDRESQQESSEPE